MRHGPLRIAKGLLSTAVLLWLVWYLFDHRDLLAQAAKAPPRYLAGLALLILTTWLFNSLQVLLFLRLAGLRIGFWENLLLQNATQLGNYVPMRLGTVLRFRYLKTVHGIEYTRLGGIAGMRTVLLTIAAGALGCVGLAVLAREDSVSLNPALWPIFLGMIVVPLAIWWIAAHLTFSDQTWRGRLAQLLLSSFSALRQRPATALRILALLLMQFVVLALRLQISFTIVGVELSPWALLLLAPTGTLLAFLTLTPGNLGLREWVIGVLSLATGYSFTDAVIAGVVDRAVLMICVFILGSLSLPLLIRRWRNATGSHGNAASDSR
ncbi:MAG: lysylphosphatidylglycerol synthase transmembrane domain-containing protein [Pseudomonadota bacterium]